MSPVEGGGGAFATICNLFSKVYFVTIYLSFKKGKMHHHPPFPPKRKFSKYVAGVILCAGMKNRESWEACVGEQS